MVPKVFEPLKFDCNNNNRKKKRSSHVTVHTHFACVSVNVFYLQRSMLQTFSALKYMLDGRLLEYANEMIDLVE